MLLLVAPPSARCLTTFIYRLALRMDHQMDWLIGGFLMVCHQHRPYSWREVSFNLFFLFNRYFYIESKRMQSIMCQKTLMTLKAHNYTKCCQSVILWLRSVRSHVELKQWFTTQHLSLRVCLLLIYILATSKVISGWVPTCDSAPSTGLGSDKY